MDRPDSEDVIQTDPLRYGAQYQGETLSAQTDGGGNFQHDAQQADPAERPVGARISRIWSRSITSWPRSSAAISTYKQTKSLIDYDDLLTKLRDLLAESSRDVRNRCPTPIVSSWSTSIRTPITCRRRSSGCWPRPMTMSRWSATMPRAFIRFAAPIFATSWISPSSFPARASSSWKKTTAAPSRS